jgi:hypothetical protein
MSDWILRHRVACYFVLNIAIAVGAPLSAVVHGAPVARAIYGAVLFAICSAPLLLLQTLTSRYILLAVFMGTYFMHFGALDLQYAFLGGEFAPTTGVLAPAEGAALLGGLLALLGYLFGDRLVPQRQARGPESEWPVHTLLSVGLLLWAIGTVDVLYYQVFIIPEKTNAAAQRGFAELGAYLTFALLLLQLLQPFGLLMLAYGYARRRGLLWASIVITVVALQVVVAFVTDVKSTALIAGLIVIMTRTLVDRKLPTGWIVAGVAFIVLVFPVFQAYRTEITGVRGLNRAQAFMELGKVLQIALSSREKVQQGDSGERAQTFVERAYIKDNLAAVMQHVGTDIPYLHGSSLVAIPMAFVPRILAPDKDSLSVGQLFTKQIARSDEDTYISISHLGELYWNFGWPGIFFGMSLTGIFLGVVGARASVEQGASMTRIMVLVATVQTMCIGFEGEIPNSYVVWMRSIAAIGLLHLLFARRLDRVGPPAARTLVPGARPQVLQRFPNVMR